METKSSKLRVVLDTTVIVLWFRNKHPKRIKAIELRDKFLKGTLDILIPDLALYELEQSLRQCASYNPEKIDLAIHSLRSMGLQIIPTSTVCLTRAIELSKNLFTSYPASYFLAIAEYYHYLYITADEDFYNKVSDWQIVQFLK